jgi:hypothetical protein
MSTAEGIVWGLLSFILLIVWVRWAPPVDQKKDEPPKVSKAPSRKLNQKL